MKNNYSFKQKLKYRIDATFSKGTSSLILILGITSLIIITLFGVIYTVTGILTDEAGKVSFSESLWQSLMRSIDAGTVAGDISWEMRLFGLLITIGGIFILSSLIGILTSGLEEKLGNLRKGRSIVIEKGHTLILGWSPKIYNIIEELIIANENVKKAKIVIMSDLEKTEMEDEIKNHIENLKTTKIICRTGSPIDLKDLKIVNPDYAKSIIIISPNEENPDIFVIKSVLALTHNPNRKKDKYHIVAEIKEKENLEAAYIAGKDEAVFVFSQELIARITAQTSRQSGLSVVYTQILSFEGVEIYYQYENRLTGKTYKEALKSYNDSAVIGLINSEGEVKLNPDKETQIKEGFKIIAISEDDDTIILSGITDFGIERDKFSGKTPEVKNKIERNLILGWNPKGYIIAKELDNYVSKESVLDIITESENPDIIKEGLSEYIDNQNITVRKAKFYNRFELSKLEILSYDNIIILSLQNYEPQEADGKTIITLLHLRSMAEKEGVKANIVSEMNIQKNRELAEVTKADDFIISEDIISGIISQLSESKMLEHVFNDLFDSDGSEIYLKNYTNYLKENSKVNFYTVTEAALEKNHTAIGYRKTKLTGSLKDKYGVFINPPKDKEIEFEEGDKIIVLSED